MVGVQLKATWMQTKKINGDIIQDRVTKTINAWKAGKFMPLTMRSRSVNNYALSKAWFRCATVDLRECDIQALNKSVKSWLCADLLQKPSEVIMCRPIHHGGLGLASIRNRAKAALIRTFLETSANPNFRQSLLHSNMFRYHVLGDSSLPNPGFLPYYPPAFFATIRKVHQDTSLNVCTMSIKEWTKYLTEENLTMETSITNTRQLRPCYAESLSPDTDWDLSWRLCRLAGLGSDLTSFNFKLLHRLLVTRERMHQINPVTSPLCCLCLEANEDLQHTFIHCVFNQGVGQQLLTIVQEHLPAMSAQSLLRLELPLSADKEFGVIFFTSTILSHIWNKRMSRSRITLYDIRSSLEAKCLLLRKTRYERFTQLLQSLLNSL